MVGTISMDNLTIDLGPDTEVKPGEEAVLIGPQGEEAILAEEIAARLATINYEVTCGDLGPGAAPVPGVSLGERLARLRPRCRGPRARCEGGDEAWIVGGAVRDAALGREVSRPRPRRSGDPARRARRRSPRSWRRARLRALGRVRHLAGVAPPTGAGRSTPRSCAGTASRPTWRARTSRSAPSPCRSRAGEPIDPFGGLADLERGLLARSAQSSFAGDPLRLLRAARLAAELGLEVDPGTVASGPRRAPRAAEPAGRAPAGRAAAALLGGPDPLRGLALLDELELTAFVLPELESTAWGRTGAQPPPRRLWPHARGAGAHARGRGRPGALRGRPCRRRLPSCSHEPLADRDDRAHSAAFGALLHDIGKPATRR